MEINKFSNESISRLLKEVAAAYEVRDEDRFRIRAYQNAASAIEHATSEIKDIWEEGKLTDLPGVGSSIAGHLDEYFKTGKVKHFLEVFKELPQGMFGLFGLQGIGAKTAYKLAKELKIKDREEALEIVKKAAQEGKISQIEGFGEQKEAAILEAIEKLKPNKDTRKRLLLPLATAISEKYMAYLKENKDVMGIEPLGSLRRRVATVGDIDFAISTTNPSSVIKHFINYREVGEVLNEGEVKASVLLKTGVRVDLMTENPEAFGALLQHFTGSKAHNIELRKYALERAASLSEHGIKKGGKTHIFKDEKSFYTFIGLPLIPVEIREGNGEIEAALKGELPSLVDLDDIKGDLHIHTNYSDGRNSLEEMVDALVTKKYEYFGITDHAPSTTARGE
ncbi:hypothetical protein HY419_02340, partial [candidate division WWE3 bacterium]|nr:hypothetical protein [candidate division WWE3 bacterium]